MSRFGLNEARSVASTETMQLFPTLALHNDKDIVLSWKERSQIWALLRVSVMNRVELISFCLPDISSMSKNGCFAPKMLVKHSGCVTILFHPHQSSNHYLSCISQSLNLGNGFGCTSCLLCLLIFSGLVSCIHPPAFSPGSIGCQNNILAIPYYFSKISGSAAY